MKHLLFVKNLIHFTLEYSTILKSLDISTGYSLEHQIIMYINESDVLYFSISGNG